MGELVNKLGNKDNGWLIKSNDWNLLVQGIENVEARLTDQIAALKEDVEERFDETDKKISDLGSRLDALSSEVDENLTHVKEQFAKVDEYLASLGNEIDSIKNEIEPILSRYWILTLEAPKLNFALGETAEITAVVKDFKGNKIVDRPWVDFVSVWGRLRPADGYSSLMGAGNRNLSVQVDSNGVAKAVLSAEDTEGLTVEAEQEVQGSLKTKLSTTQLSIAETILKAETPLQAKDEGAFSKIKTEYDRNGAISVRNFVDSYYIKNTGLKTQKVVPNFYHQWRDYRSTVLAFVKNDADPRTPDQSRAVSSIQITFRDWIGPWLTLEYFAEVDTLLTNYKNRLGSSMVITDKFSESLSNVKQEVASIVGGKGFVAKQRDYQIIDKAIGSLDLINPPSFVATLATSVKGAVGVQRMLDTTGAYMDNAKDGETIAMDAFTYNATQSEKTYLEVKEKLSAVEDNVSKMDIKVKNVDSGMQVLEERTQNIQNTGSNVQNDIVSMRGDLEKLTKLDIEKVSTTMNYAEVLWKDRLGIK
jgi:predicted  nucleic acid-binding Zn-ribbon protein